VVDNSLGTADYYDISDYVGIGTRILVFLIDSVVLVIVSFVLWMPFAALWEAGVFRKDPSGYFLLTNLAAIWTYLAPVKRSRVGTLGYQLLGVELVSAKGGRPSLLKMTFRMMMWMFGPFNFVLDLLWLGADTESQALRDCYLGIYLVKRGARPIGRAPVHISRYTAMGFVLNYPRVCRPNRTVSQN
jgi:uncharacterized RDD family membrane protein YckC